MENGKIIILEDDMELLETLSDYLSLKNYDVRCTGCALDFFQALIGAEYDVAIVDIGLPDKSGFEVVEHLRRKTSMGIIVLTARDSIRDKMRGYKAGADHYFTKPLDLRELSAAVGSLVERLESIAPARRAANDQWSLDLLRWTLSPPGGDIVPLTEKEMKFLELVLSQGGEAVSRDVLLSTLGYQADVYGSRALAVMVTRLRKKIREQTGVEAPIKAVRSQGYGFSASARLV